MIFSYDYFVGKLNTKIKSDQSFYNELLITVVQNPNRYTGVFRLSNAKTKLVQNVTQSREIKFGDFMEEIVTEYIEKMGYSNLNKSIGTDEDGNALSADQVFMSGNDVYLIEQKIRDDHDSTKKRGQYSNFKKKYSLLKKQYPGKNVTATMWFIDDSLVKNKNYYRSESSAETLSGVNINILYGGELFSELFHRVDVWEEITSYLFQNKLERSDELLYIPDFDKSDEILNALINLKKIQNYKADVLKSMGYKGQVRGLFNKLMSDRTEYVQLRKELFPTGYNFNRMG